MSTSQTHRLVQLGGVLSVCALSFGAGERTALGAGTAIDLQSARATGMAAAMIGHVDDSSAIFYNPAGIVRGAGVMDGQAGVTLLVPRIGFTSTSGKQTSGLSQAIPAPNAYLTYGILDQVTVGLGMFAPFGTSMKWPNEWQGRTLITTSTLQTFYINPTVAVRLGRLRLGGGLQIVRGVVDLKRKLNFVDSEGEVELGAATWGGGINFGAQLDVLDNLLSVGVSYRSAVRLAFDDGKAQFTGVPLPLATTLHDQPVRTALTQPDVLGFGVALRPLEGLLLDFDVVYTAWQRLKSIDITFPNDRSGTLSSSSSKNWTGTVNYHLGAEYAISRNISVRTGVMYDPTPTPENTLTPEIPDGSRVNLAVGGGYTFDMGLRAEVGYQCLLFVNQKTTAPTLSGSYGGDVQIIGLSLGFHQ